MAARIIIAFTVAAVLTLVPAVFHGYYEHRWGNPADLTAVAKQVERLPKNLGNWKVTNEGEQLLDVIYKELGLAGYVTRTYTDQKTGYTINLLLMVGKSGPLIRHPPYVCYANRANEQVGDMTKIKIDATSPPSEFNLLEYKRPQSLTNDRFLVAYAMATGPIWSAPSMPRMEFGGAPALYKVQMLVSLQPGQDREVGTTVLKQFAADFCTAFEQLLLTDKVE